MPVTLQSTINGGFSRDFVRKLPELENAMLAHGLEPAQFVISKDRAADAYPWIGPFFYQYTVFIGDDNFVVTEPNDEQFYAYLYGRIIAVDEEDDAAPAAVPVPGPPGLITRFMRWMDKPV